MAGKLEWLADAETFYRSLETQFPYPFIAKPADDGCSSAVKKIKTRAELEAFSQLIFRTAGRPDARAQPPCCSLGFKEEFPQQGSLPGRNPH